MGADVLCQLDDRISAIVCELIESPETLQIINELAAEHQREFEAKRPCSAPLTQAEKDCAQAANEDNVHRNQYRNALISKYCNTMNTDLVNMDTGEIICRAGCKENPPTGDLNCPVNLEQFRQSRNNYRQEQERQQRITEIDRELATIQANENDHRGPMQEAERILAELNEKGEENWDESDRNTFETFEPLVTRYYELLENKERLLAEKRALGVPDTQAEQEVQERKRFLQGLRNREQGTGGRFQLFRRNR